MQNTEYKQIKLADDGQILFQADPTNPLPGAPVARVKKGASLLEPDVEALIDGIGDEGMQKLRAWLKYHIFTVLESLMPLASELDAEGPARDIARKLHANMGTMLRADLEGDIAKLDEAGRALLRQKKMRMGPILVFLPALNKPAAVRLRALLWSLWNDKPLPALVPKDGATSAVIADESADAVYYRTIGYPLYAGRAIRVDMLDRLVGEIYDCAKDGKFQAKHKMAEWLGCSVPHLYGVLEALGHKKTHDPADDAVKTAEEKPAESAVPAAAVPEVTPPAEEGKKEEATPPAAESAPAAPPAAPAKPELSTFTLKKGRAYSGARRPPRPELLSPEEMKEREERRKQRAEKKKSGDRPEKPFKKKKFDKDRGRDDRQDRVFATAKAQPETSPFAALMAMKTKTGEGQK